MKIPAFLGLYSICYATSALGQAMSEGEIHDRIVAVMERVTHRPVAVGDTFVTWSPNPVLYTTVQWTNQPPGIRGISSSLARADSLVGTADAIWDADGLVSSVVVWTRPDSALVKFEAWREGAAIHLAGTVDTLVPQPAGQWAIADYGMEDQLLPIVTRIDLRQRHSIHVYRPFGRKWDILEVTGRTHGAYRDIEITAPDGERFFWVVTEDDMLLRITRSEHEHVERRPLEATGRYAQCLEYVGSR